MTLKLIWVITALLLALISGLFYAYSCSVNPGLGRLSDSHYLKAMQSINRAILNPIFFLSFIGALCMLPIATWAAFKTGGTDVAFYLLLAGFIIYALGVFGVTALGNVPLNEMLDKFDIASAMEHEIQEKRLSFEALWNKFHSIRTWANLAALVCVLWALIKD